MVHHIVKTPGVMGGRARVRGKRIRVMDIVAWMQMEPWGPEEVVANFDGLTLADVHAALAYYYDNRLEVEGSYAEDEAFAARMLREHPDRIRVLPA